MKKLSVQLIQELSSLTDTIPAGFKGLFAKPWALFVKNSDGSEHAIITDELVDQSVKNGASPYFGTLYAEEFNGVKKKINTVTNNLGSPSVEEMALCHGQFSNKLRFIPANLQEESTDGTSWNPSVIASASQLADLMLGEGQTISISLPNNVDFYRLTWDSPGYCFLNTLYIANSTNGSVINVKIEVHNNALGWTELVNGNTSNWPGHCYIPHTTIPFMEAGTTYHFGKVRITFSIITRYSSNSFDLYGIEWFGGYPAGRRNVESYDRDKNVYFPQSIIAGLQLHSQAPNGTPPIVIASQTEVDNLNAAQLNGKSSSVELFANTIVARDNNKEIDQLIYKRALSVGGLHLNTITAAGFYDGATLGGAPDIGWFYITVERHNASANWVHQTLTSFGSDNLPNHIYSRTCVAGTWTPLLEIYTTGNFIAGTHYATPAQVATAIANLVASSPAALDTLNELAAAMGNDPNFATTILNALAGKAASVHSHSKSQITDFPSSMPASDVYAWAKQPAKPTYYSSEISGLDHLSYHIGQDDGSNGRIAHIGQDDQGWFLLIISGDNIYDNSMQDLEWVDSNLYNTYVNAESSWDGSFNSGSGNTWQIINQNPQSGAALECFTYQGSQEWYLPSIYELNLIFQNAAIINACINDPNKSLWHYDYSTQQNVIYWSSTEASSHEAFGKDFCSGITIKMDKNSINKVRAVRKQYI